MLQTGYRRKEMFCFASCYGEGHISALAEFLNFNQNQELVI